MNLIDILLGALLIFFGYLGWSAGFFSSVSSLVGIVLGFSLGIAYMTQVAIKILHYISLPTHLALLIAFLIIVGLVTLAFRLLGSVLHIAVRSSPVSQMDSIGGLAFGLFKGALVCSALIFFLSIFPLSQGLALRLEQSHLGKPIGNLAPLVFNGMKVFLPKTTDFYSHVMGSLDKVSQMRGEKKSNSDNTSPETLGPDKPTNFLKRMQERTEERKRATEELMKEKE